MAHIFVHVSRSLAALAATVSMAGAALAQPDPNYVPPKGGYDVPVSFIKPLAAAGETYERTLGEPQTNGYQRQARLKVLGLENLSRLTALQETIKQGDEAERKRVQDQQAEKPGSTGGQLGALLGKLNPLMSKEVERQKEVAADQLVIKLVEAGSPADTARAAIADVYNPPGGVGGSIFGVKINNNVRVDVTSDDFKPRVLIVRHKPKSTFSGPMDDAIPEFSVMTQGEIGVEGTNRATATYDVSTKSTDGSRGTPVIVVTSDDGKAVSGKYTIRYRAN
jgi:hypothetical protein